MKSFIDNFMSRSKGQRIGMIAGSIAFLIFIYWQYFFKSVSEELAKEKEKIENLQTQITTQNRLIRNLPRVKAEVKELDIALKKAKMELPDAREIPELLASVSDLATNAGLEVSLFKPRPENIREFYAEVPVAVAIRGSYHQVATFFDEVGQLDRIVNINGIGLGNPKVGDISIDLQADCIATTFRYLEEEERLRYEKAKGGKKRK